jgi:hypothetical protein
VRRLVPRFLFEQPFAPLEATTQVARDECALAEFVDDLDVAPPQTSSGRVRPIAGAVVCEQSPAYKATARRNSDMAASV